MCAAIAMRAAIRAARRAATRAAYHRPLPFPNCARCSAGPSDLGQRRRQSTRFHRQRGLLRRTSGAEPSCESAMETPPWRKVGSGEIGVLGWRAAGRGREWEWWRIARCHGVVGALRDVVEWWARYAMSWKRELDGDESGSSRSWQMEPAG